MIHKITTKTENRVVAAVLSILLSFVPTLSIICVTLAHLAQQSPFH